MLCLQIQMPLKNAFFRIRSLKERSVRLQNRPTWSSRGGFLANQRSCLHKLVIELRARLPTGDREQTNKIEQSQFLKSGFLFTQKSTKKPQKEELLNAAW